MAKTITDIIPPSRRRQLENAGELPPQEPEPLYQASNPPTPPAPPRPLSDRGPEYSPGGPRKTRSFPWGIALIALVIVIGSGVALYAFAAAQVSITPTSNTTTVSGNFSATYNSGDLPYAIVTVDKTVSSNVPAESTETVNDPAQGTITIYNTQATSQTLIKNTRFQTSAGLVFRIQDSVTIPGGSVSSPGSVKATVYADTGGDQYNIGPTTFTVPGLSGSAAFTQVTAKSTEAFTGGFAGTRPSVSQATRDAQNEKSKAALNTALTSAITSQLPAGYVVLPGATFTSYTPVNDTVGKDNSVNVNLKGTAVAVAFPNAALAKTIAYQTVGSYSGQKVSLSDWSGLTLTPSSQGTPTAEQGTFAFSLAGKTTIVWDVDPQKVAGAVAGKDRKTAYSIIQSFPEVHGAVLTVRPFWASSFPQDPADIKVSTTSPQN
ncbi:MAG TPA: hypothetical protein VN086_01330 [Candidatus Paceibacterota bacterium]|nr:hypothetical protein [Candidatus Paceibacterota bacterium]